MLGENTLVQNRYLVKNLIGRGGMGAVYLAEDTRFNNRVIALKEMLFTNNEKLEAAFGREANLLAHLQHPRLPKVSDYFNENGFQYLVMEYVAGDDLGTLLHKNGRAFPLHRVLNWADSLLETLEYLHAQHPPVLHRDIKPQNLKLNPEDKVILLDFGLAKDTMTHLSRLASANSLVGFTPNYAPLEQIKGDHATAQTDLYSVAATIYHLLTNHSPASSLNRVQAKIDDAPDPLLPAHHLNPEIPFRLSEILTQGLTLKREDRPLSATAMRRSLKETFDQPRRLFEVPPETHEANAVKTMAFAAPTMMAYTPSRTVSPEAPKQVFTSPKPVEKRSSVLLFGALICLLAVGIVGTYFVGQWIAAKSNPVVGSQETTTTQDETNQTGSSKDVSASTVNSAKNTKATVKTPANVSKPENKPVVDPKTIQPQKTEKVSVTPKSVQTPAVTSKPVQNTKPETTTEDGEILQ